MRHSKNGMRKWSVSTADDYGNVNYDYVDGDKIISYNSLASEYMDGTQRYIGGHVFQTGDELLEDGINYLVEKIAGKSQSDEIGQSIILFSDVLSIFVRKGNVFKKITSLGTSRTSAKKWLQNVGNLERSQLIKDLEKAGFKKVYEGKGMMHFQRGNWKIRLDPPHLNGKNPTPYNHMHINRGGNKNTFDIFLNPVNPNSPAAHIRIK